MPAAGRLWIISLFTGITSSNQPHLFAAATVYTLYYNHSGKVVHYLVYNLRLTVGYSPLTASCSWFIGSLALLS